MMFVLLYLFISHVNAGTLLTSMPYSTADIALFPNQFGDLRSTRGSSDIPCVQWNTNLATQAQTWADQCETAFASLTPQPAAVTTIDCYDTGLGTNIYTSLTSTDVPNTVFQWMVDGDLYYTYQTGGCTTGQEWECQNYKQWSSSQVQEIGCGKAQCASITGTRNNGLPGFVTICAYGAIQDQAATAKPFNLGTCLTPTVAGSLCPPNTDTCTAFAISSLCCATNTALNSCTSNSTCRGQWLRMYSNAARNHFYTTSATEQTTALGIGYVNDGNEGYVMRGPYSGGIQDGDPAFRVFCEVQCPAKVPIYRAYSRQKRDHLYTANSGEGGIGNNNGSRSILPGGYFTNFGIVGYCMPTNNTCGATVPIYRYFRGGLFNWDHFYSTSATANPNTRARGRYNPEGIMCYGWTN